jgi:hypothetical protein
VQETRKQRKWALLVLLHYSWRAKPEKQHES